MFPRVHKCCLATMLKPAKNLTIRVHKTNCTRSFVRVYGNVPLVPLYVFPWFPHREDMQLQSGYKSHAPTCAFFWARIDLGYLVACDSAHMSINLGELNKTAC